MLGKKPCLPYL